MGAVRCRCFGRCDPSPKCGEPLLHPGGLGPPANARSIANKRKGENSMRTTGMGTAIVCSCLVLWTTVLLAPRAVAQAQAGTGQIVGTVYDASRSVVAQASVLLSAKDTGLQREEKTDEEGGYRFALLPVGNYTLTFNAPGMKTYKVNLEVTVGAAQTVNAYLQVGGVTESIEVTAQNVIESTAPSADALIGVKSIEELPINGRRFQD